MIGTVGIKEAVFTSRYAELINATTPLNTTALDTSALIHDSAALKKYIELFQTLTDEVELYKSLVVQDTTTIHTVAESYVAMDSDLMSIWRI